LAKPPARTWLLEQRRSVLKHEDLRELRAFNHPECLHDIAGARLSIKARHRAPFAHFAPVCEVSQKAQGTFFLKGCEVDKRVRALQEGPKFADKFGVVFGHQEPFKTLIKDQL